MTFGSISLEVEDVENLHIDIYTIGYLEEGETLLTVLCDGERSLFTVLTDCYGVEDYNHVHQVMSDTKASHIDAFIWTHPDKDHSVDIPTILKTYDTTSCAHVFLPMGINERMGIGEDANQALAYITDHYNKGTKYNANYICLNKNEVRSMLSLKIHVRKTNAYIDCRFNFLLPMASIIERRIIHNGDILLNDLSIFYIMTFNDFNYVFTGDLSKQNIQFIDEAQLENVVYVKIPHHGSDTLEKFILKLRSQGAKDVISTTTVYRQNSLPKESVLEEYAKFSKGVYCTGLLSGLQKEKYGCIHGCFDINGNVPFIDCKGNAFQYMSGKMQLS